MSSPGTYLTSAARNLGFEVNDELKFDKQINSVVKLGFFQLRQISKIKSVLPGKDLEKLVHAFITCRFDYSNSLYFGTAQSAVGRIQLVQNAAARVLTKTHKHQHITPALRSLH